MDKRLSVFETPTLKEGSGYKSSVGFAQIVFTYAYCKANGPSRNALQEMEYAQSLVESWIPELKKLGIKGSIEPESNKYRTWEEISKMSRAEIAKMKKG